MSLTLILLPQPLTIARLDPQDLQMSVPAALWQDSFWGLMRTEEELSLVGSSEVLRVCDRCEPGWRALQVVGPLDFALTGILASLASPLAAAQISIFAISTFDTDYVLIKESDLQQAIQVLIKAGHQVSDREGADED